VIFVPIYWAWVGTSINANLRDVDNPLDRVAIFTIGLCSLFLAMAVPGAYGGRGMLFATAYFAIRLILASLFFHGRRWFFHPFLVSLCVTGPLILLGGVADGGWRVGIWAVAALVDVSLPTLLQGRVRPLSFDAKHLPERYGLLVLIALGESIVAIGAPAATAPDVAAEVMAAVAAAFVLACGLWWVYRPTAPPCRPVWPRLRRDCYMGWGSRRARSSTRCGRRPTRDRSSARCCRGPTWASSRGSSAWPPGSPRSSSTPTSS
jgi:low temperature requirement protein LtrA